MKRHVGKGSRTVRLLRWALAVVATVGVLTLAAPSARAECKDFTTDNRECTAMEELGYCLTNAMESYAECKDGAGLIMKGVCTVAYEVDFYMCYAEWPFKW